MGFSQEEGWTISVIPERIKYIMNTSPQAVTERYVSNLISYGRNREFAILKITMHHAIANEEIVGEYFTVKLDRYPFVEDTKPTEASGATIALAVRRCLEKHGVTFR